VTAPEAPRRAEGASRIGLTINGEVRTVPRDSTLADVLTSLSLDPRTVVVEHNREIVRDRDSYGSRRLQAGDVLELVHFVGGG
jgi:sulfur carrier protein